MCCGWKESFVFTLLVWALTYDQEKYLLSFIRTTVNLFMSTMWDVSFLCTHAFED